MTTQTAEQKLDWHTSQIRWHSRRHGSWHKSQARWHRKAIGRIPGVFSIIVSRALRNNTPALVQNITKNNALFQMMKSGQRGTKVVRDSYGD